MLEAIASWTTLSIRWSIGVEWLTRQQTGLNEAFLEDNHDDILEAGPGEVVKVLNPDLPVTPIRAILLLRDPVEVSVSARKIGQIIHPEDVTARVEAFRAAGWPIDEVHMDELVDLPVLFARLKGRGWPVVGPSTTILTKAVR